MMRKVHPDSGAPEQNCRYLAHEVNLAYEVLSSGRTGERGHIDHRRAGDVRKEGTAKHTSRTDDRPWDAPINPYAYREREIFHYVEDYEGNILGNFSIARGKYLWKTEEDFPLFLLSIYQCGKDLLDEIDDRLQRNELTMLRQEIQPELTSLLSQQFIDGTTLLSELAKENETEKGRIFSLPAMLELAEAGTEAKVGEALFPSRLRKHRLYLKNQAGRELGYLSFLDDRMYYVVIPLFEQKRAKVKLKVSEKQGAKKRRGKDTGRYQNLHLWIKLPNESGNGLPESLGLQIERLLSRYEKA